MDGNQVKESPRVSVTFSDSEADGSHNGGDREGTQRPKKSSLKSTSDDDVKTDHAENPPPKYSKGDVQFSDIDICSGNEFDGDQKSRVRRRRSIAERFQSIGAATRKGRPCDWSRNTMLVELQELMQAPGEEGEMNHYQWQETARWVKYEENYEPDAGHWGKPHVSCLPFHTLLELKNALATGLVLLDLDEPDMEGVVGRIGDELVAAGAVERDVKEKIVTTLLSKQKHVHSRRLNRSGSNVLERQPSRGNNNIAMVENGVMSNGHYTKQEGIVNPAYGQDPENQEKETPAIRGILKNQSQVFAEEAEACCILVGRADFLDEPVQVFVRMDEDCYLRGMNGTDLPTRYLYIALGPMHDDMDYNEVGRCMGAIMSTLDFQQVAWEATGRGSLLKGITKFLDDSLVLPAGDWNEDSMKPVMEMARKKANEVRRKSLHPLAINKEELAQLGSSIDPYGNPMNRTGKVFGGMINDIKRRYPYYLSDIKDGLNFQCFATFFFIFFACLAPAITFGGLMSDKTQRWMGVTETLLATAVVGMVFGLFSAQPIKIIGVTGPMLLFEESLYQICDAMGLEYISFHLWIFVWIGVIAVIVAATDGSVLVGLISRFTEEIFSALISLLFIYETFFKLYNIFVAHPLRSYYRETDNITIEMAIPINGSFDLHSNYTDFSNNTMISTPAPPAIIREEPNTALLSLILTLGTFGIAWYLKLFRNGKYLGRTARRALGDFGIPIAILIMVLVDFLIADTYTEKLDVPDGLIPTASEKRGWIINPMGMEKPLPIWAIFAAIIPAILGFILIFMESQISGVIINKPERNLQKGSGYHLDILIIGVLHIMNGFLGLPMMCAAAVRSISHVNALSVWSRTHAPGEKPRLIHVHEQRVTAVLVHVVIAVSTLMGPVLRQVPLSVLFGVFLYMGVASMNGVQLFERIELMIMPTKHYPNEEYVNKVRTWKMHLFTSIQVLCLVVLWIVKSTAAALAFPFFLILTIPVQRYFLPVIFSKKELKALNKTGNETDDEEEDEGDLPDFYAEAHMSNVRRRSSGPRDTLKDE